jgi:lipopolysaccharide transport protein LptA
MANSLGRTCICALALASSALAAQDGAPKPNELGLVMKSFEIDGKTSLVHVLGPLTVTQGDVTIEADEAVATGMDSRAKSEWKLSGHVRIRFASAVLTADSAAFTFDEKQLARGEITGQATFEDTRPERKQSARGGANKIVYDYAGRTLRLTEKAWFQGEGVQATGCDIVYNLNTERASGSSDCEDPFQLRFPRKQGASAAGADPPP